MGSNSASAEYIRMVQHLIEECIVFNMSKEECMEALQSHANINPIITSTVWRELERENKEFFEAYAKKREEKGSGSGSGSESSESRQQQQRRERIQEIVSVYTRKNRNSNNNSNSNSNDDA